MPTVTQKRTDTIVSNFSRRVKRLLGDKLVAIYWFGSRAKGRGSADSDYDFLIETRDNLSVMDRNRIAEVSVEISARNGVVLDVHYDTWGALHGRQRFMTPFRDTVLSEAVAV